MTGSDRNRSCKKSILVNSALRRNNVHRVVMYNLPDGLDLLLARWLSLANEHVPCLLRTPRNLQELIKLQHPPLTARPSFAALMEDRLAGVMNTFLLVPRSRTRPSSTAASPATRCIGWDLQLRVIGVRFFYLRLRRGR